MPFLSFLRGPTLYLAAALAVAVVVGGFLLERANDKAAIATLAASAGALKETNASNVMAMAQARASYDASVAALTRAKANSEARAASVIKIYQEILSATPDQDGPVAPVMRRALERLFGAPANDGSQASDHPAGSAGGAVQVPAGAGAAGR